MVITWSWRNTWWTFVNVDGKRHGDDGGDDDDDDDDDDDYDDDDDDDDYHDACNDGSHQFWPNDAQEKDVQSWSIAI